MNSRHSRGGPIPRWGPGPRKPCTIHWPEAHREVYEDAAAALGLSFNEYVLRCMAKMHDLPGPREEHDPQIALSA